MKIYLASDHAGFELKEKVKVYLHKEKFIIQDFGAFTYDKNDDYPDFISQAAKSVSKDPKDNAIIFGGSGQGEAIVANKFKNIRATVFYGPRLLTSSVDIQGRKSSDPFEVVRLSREHNDANILSLGARMLTEEEAIQAVKIWFATPSSKNPRYIRRTEKVLRIERTI